MIITKPLLNWNTMLTKPLAPIAFMILVLLFNTCTKARHNSENISDTTRYTEVYNTSDKSWVICTGNLVLSQEGRYHIAAPMSGIIKSVCRKENSYVNAGSVLARLENNDILKLQQDYLEAVNHFQFLGEEYKRQGELTVENATSMKRMQMAKYDYQSAEIKMNALHAQLTMLGINADSIKFNMLSPFLEIKAPRSGYVSEINIRPGSFVQTGHDLLEICDNQKLLVKLFVPENVVRLVKKDQKVEFSLVFDSVTVYEANIYSLATSIDPEKHTAEVLARLTMPEDFFLAGMTVNAKILIKTTLITK